MLILTRSRGEAVDVTDTRTGEVVARIIVQEVRPGSVRLGFEAPRYIHILRDDAIERTAKHEGKPA